MSTAIAMAPSPAPHERPSLSSDLAPTPTKAPAVVAPLPPVITAHGSVSPSAPKTATPTQRTGSSSPNNTPGLTVTSPHTSTRLPNGPPKIVVKKEPGSPSMPISRPRPSRLDLSKNKNVSNSNNPASARPMTAREPLGIQEMGIHCLSPGFVTDDPHMKDHIQRSMSVREQQRHIIEARLHQQSSKGDSSADRDTSSFAAKTPGMAQRRNKAPPGLSIVAPSHKQFANERVIQSAPLGQSFTGRNNPAPYSRHLANQPSALSSTSHIHHIPANQTDNRLPPISDVFGQGLSGHHDNTPASLYPNSARAPPASPGPPPPPGPPSSRPREYKSAEEAQHEMAGGRPELLPKLVHYGGHQPPTPPSPAPGSRIAEASRSASKRRTRAEYEDGSPPLGYGPGSAKRGPFGAGRDSPETQRQKREEFLKLCERAWDLFHS